MIGNNTMVVNQATMIAAVQMYLNSMLTEQAKVVVRSIESDNSIHHTFRIELGDDGDDQ